MEKNNLKNFQYFNKLSSKYQNNFKKKKSGKFLEFDTRKKIILNFIRDKKGSLLDVGCGDGSISVNLLKTNKFIKKVTFLDFSEQMIKITKNKTKNLIGVKKKYIIGDIFLTKTKNKYDIILAVGILGHIKNIEKLMKLLKKKSKKNGLIVIQFTKQNHLFSNIYKKIMNLTNIKNEKYSWHSNIKIFNEISKNNLTVVNTQSYKLGIPFLDNISKKLNYFLEKNTYFFSQKFGTEKILILKND